VFGALVAMLVGCLIGAVLACVATGPADRGAATFDSATHVYDDLALVLSQREAASYVRNPPPAPEAASWVSPVSVHLIDGVQG